MSFKVFMMPQATHDLKVAAIWYNKQQKGLGKKFLTEVKHYKKALAANPFFVEHYTNVHTLPLKIFPFMIHFIIDEKNKEIVILAVLHTSQSPESWPK